MTDTPDNSNHKRAYDVTVEKIARVYAEATLNAAEAESVQDHLIDELRELVSGVLDRYPAVEKMFAAELISRDEKRAIIDRVFAGRMSKMALGLLQVLAQHHRLSILRQVVESACLLWEQRSGHTRVEVQFASEPEPALKQEIAQALRTTLGAKLVITTTVDPELIAGFVVRVGDKLYDASARTGFERARQAMIARAYEAIQSRPQEFMES